MLKDLLIYLHFVQLMIRFFINKGIHLAWSIIILIMVSSVSCQKANLSPQNASELISSLVEGNIISEKETNIYSMIVPGYGEFLFDSNYIEYHKIPDRQSTLFRIGTPGDYRNKLVFLSSPEFDITWTRVQDVGNFSNISVLLDTEAFMVYQYDFCSRLDMNYSKLLWILNKRNRNITILKLPLLNKDYYGALMDKLDIWQLDASKNKIFLSAKYFNPDYKPNNTDVTVTIYFKGTNTTLSIQPDIDLGIEVE